jgi:trigger factor
MTDLGKNAETRVRRDLALEQLAEDMGVRLTDVQFNAALSALAQQNNTTVQQLRSQLGPNGLNGYYANIIREQALSQAVSQLSQGESDSETAETAETKPKSARAKKADAGEAEAEGIEADGLEAQSAEAKPKAKRAKKAAEEQETTETETTPTEASSEGLEQTE